MLSPIKPIRQPTRPTIHATALSPLFAVVNVLIIHVGVLEQTLDDLIIRFARILPKCVQPPPDLNFHADVGVVVAVLSHVPKSLADSYKCIPMLPGIGCVYRIGNNTLTEIRNYTRSFINIAHGGIT